jgi:hypothetical protein
LQPPPKRTLKRKGKRKRGLETDAAAATEAAGAAAAAAPPSPPPPAERRFKCQECCLTFNVRKNLVLHEASHKDSPFICPDWYVDESA